MSYMQSEKGRPGGGKMLPWACGFMSTGSLMQRHSVIFPLAKHPITC